MQELRWWTRWRRRGIRRTVGTVSVAKIGSRRPVEELLLETMLRLQCLHGIDCLKGAIELIFWAKAVIHNGIGSLQGTGQCIGHIADAAVAVAAPAACTWRRSYHWWANGVAAQLIWTQRWCTHIHRRFNARSRRRRRRAGQRGGHLGEGAAQRRWWRRNCCLG